MDPLSIAGLAFGVVSLTFELFSGCVKGYHLLLEAKDMPKSYRYLLVRLQMERDKLLGWAVLANVAEDESSLKPALLLSKHIVNDVLREMQVLLLGSSQLEGRYKPQLIVAEDAIPDEGLGGDSQDTRVLRKEYAAIQRKALVYIDQTRKLPKRLRWASFDKSKFERLLSDVGALNDNMMHYLESYERRRHLEMQEVTFMEILQVNNRMDDLIALLGYLQQSALTAGQRRAYDERLVRLTRFKAISIAIEQQRTDQIATDRTALLGGARMTATPKLPFDRLTCPKGSADRESRSPGLYSGVPVWVEWRCYDPPCDDDDDDDAIEDDGPLQFIEQRISKLARLLRDGMKPEEFRVPDCLGYVHDLNESRFGFVFKASGSSPVPYVPVSLFDLLSNKKKPSLNTRIDICRQVATAIWYLHSTNWLHKGLRSENIVFQDGAVVSLDKPFLCGFDYSRPASIGEQTELPMENRSHDLYRHPNTQFNVPRDGRGGFKKSYDVYSLGVVLFEVAVWKPIHQILSIDLSSEIKPVVVKGVQSRLLRKESLESLQCEMGSAFTSVVRSCLEDDLGLNDVTVADTESGARLQLDFGEHIIRRLDGISV